jgi:uncharacterized protein (DUF305 family)
MATSELASSAALDGDVPPRRPAFRLGLIAVICLALLVIAGAVGYLVRGGSPAAPGVASVDAGFARDMATHHTQAVSMAGIARDKSTDPAVKTLAFDIETSQQFQIGQLDGWLSSWGLSRTSDLAQMSWMGSEHVHLTADGLMPGMASPAEMARLQTLTGRALDIDFLQLMLRHHQGGLPMAQYAAAHATKDYVRTLAQQMVQAQSAEIITMEQMLRERGASPLPAPET